MKRRKTKSVAEAEITYDLGLLEQSRDKWRASPALRTVYCDIFKAMARQCIAGPSLEVGSGIGVAKEAIPDLTTSDLIKTDFVDRAVSAYEIPAENWANILAMDTLHHLQRPIEFFASAAEALGPGGRIVLMEPAGTWWGSKFYRWFHHEPCVPTEVVPPFEFAAQANGEFANMGMGVGLTCDCRAETDRRLKELGLRIADVNYRDFLAYPATGGFSQRAVLPRFVLRGLLALEQTLPQALWRHVGLRMIIVIEKSDSATPRS